MVSTFEDIKKYLPQYLTSTGSKALFEELKSFPKNKNIYTDVLKTSPCIYQGDGMSGLFHVEIPSMKSKEINGIVISNTCDLDCDNDRIIPSRLLHSPIVNLSKYKRLLIEKFVKTGARTIEFVEQHIENISNQKLTHVFFIPKCPGLDNDSIIFFDKITSIPSDYIPSNKIIEKRLFTLSDFGFYLFLFKLSIHFTRVREGVIRN